MSNFYCDKCGALCEDSEVGYISGCEHYPPDIKKVSAQTEAEITEVVRAGRIVDGRSPTTE